jgi:hypothetical protein
MNWRRGLLRVWAVLSVFWVAAVGAAYFIDWRMTEDTPPPVRACVLADQSMWLNGVHIAKPPAGLAVGAPAPPCPIVQPPAAWGWVVVAIGVPLLNIGFGAGVVWAVQGFRRRG